MGSYKRLYYMDYYKNGEKIFAGGIVKLVPRKTEDESSGTGLSVQLSGPLQMESVVSDILLLSDRMQKNWGQVEIADGMGRTRLPDLDEVMGQMEEQIKLRLVFEGSSYLECILREGIWTQTRREEPEIPDFNEPKTRKLTHESSAAVDLEPEDLETAEVYVEEQMRVEEESKKIYLKERVSDGDALRENAPREGVPRVRNVESIRMKGDKWQQLREVLPHIRPFEDDREYLRLDLKDLIILPRLYYRLVDNSFLLHGYYNYGHLILTKVMRRGQEKICVGVPGNYYEKEKQVAVMFGFESFESKTEPADEGDFGYYMIGIGI